MAAHTHDAVLAQVKAVLSGVEDVQKVRPDDDQTWWVINAEKETFALAWYDANNMLHTEPYRP
jgi:hypothetical protein